MVGQDLNPLWQHVVAEMKERVTMPALWRALEAAIPIALDDETLVLGYAPETFQQSGLLLDARTRNTIEQILSDATRGRLRIRVIQGSTLQDWEAILQGEIEAARLQAETREAHRRELEAGATWDAVSEQLIRRLGATPHRSLASVQGRYLDGALETLADGYRRLMPESPSELDERSYSRALERIAERIGVPSALMAMLVAQRVARGGSAD